MTGGNGGAGSAATVTQQLDALSFTPTAPPPGTSATTTFVLSDVTAAGTSVSDARTSVIDTAAAPPPPPPTPTPDAVSISPLVSYGNGTFTLTGTASPAAGVRSVEISAQVDGVATDLGAATVDANGNFSFKDAIGAHTQDFITATETNETGGTAAAQASYSLTGVLQVSAYAARQDRYMADGSAVTARDLFKADGSERANVLARGQTFASSFFDRFENGGAPETTFVFSPGFGRDVVDLFRVGGADHDTLSFKGSDYGNDIATVLASAKNTSAGLLITDPVASSPGGGPGTHDTLLLKGITKQQLAANQGDIGFHV